MVKKQSLRASRQEFRDLDAAYQIISDLTRIAHKEDPEAYEILRRVKGHVQETTMRTFISKEVADKLFKINWC